MTTDNEQQTTDEYWMEQALELARRAGSLDEVPVGAVLVADNECIGEGLNQPIASHDPTAHAEINALREGGRKTGNYRLTGTTLYVTLEPCPMCAGAIIHARVARLVFATSDPRSGAAGSVYNLLQSGQLNHRTAITQGVLEGPCRDLLQAFFKRKRDQ